MKKKTCSFCNKEVDKLWYSNPKCCMDYNCRSKYNEAKGVGKNALSSQRGSNTSQKNKSRLKPMSDKQAERLKEYRIVRDEYLKQNPNCARCGTNQNISLQHLKGRIGDNLTDVNNFMTLCVPCHRFINDNPKYAIKNGFAKSRLDK